MSGAKKYTGGCHCGKFRYEVELDLSDPKASKCNCSFCLKANITSVSMNADANDEFPQFKLLSPASFDEVGNYQFGYKVGNHYFCQHCGIQCVGRAKFEIGTTMHHSTSINIVTLDPDQDVDLRKFKISYWDGKENNWEAGQKDEPWAGGCY